MENVEACIVCLDMDTTLYSLHTNSLQQYYELLTGTDLIKCDLPMFVCFQCKAMLTKFYTFRQKSFRGQAVLQSILQSHGKISADKIKQIDTSRYLLNSNLSIVNAFSINVTSEELFDLDVKLEIQEKFENNPFGDVIVGYKSDDDWFSDDEPLSQHKSRKLKNDGDVKKEDVPVDPESISYQMSHDDATWKLFSEKVTSQEKKSRVRTARTRTKASKCQDKNTADKTDKEKLVKNDEKFKRGRFKTQSALRIIHKPDVDINMPLDSYVTIEYLSEQEQQEEIAKRKESDNYQKSNYRCDLCYKGFLDKSTWQHHMQKHDKSSGPLECNVCKLRFKALKHLKKHAFGHSRKYMCNYCSYVSRNSTQAKHHLYWHQGVMYKCPYCAEILHKWTSYLSHVRIKHPSDHICGFCGYSFVSELGLAMHKSIMHKDCTIDESDKDLPYCELCDVKFANREAFTRHTGNAKKHKENAPDKNGCRLCGVWLDSATELRRHARRCPHARRPAPRAAPRPAPGWPKPCLHCGAQVASARAYWSHFRKAHPGQDYPADKPHVCDVCGKAFRANAFLLYHKNTHSNVKRFSCSECGKSFYNRANLTMHLKTHSEQRPHVCCVCAKGFKSKGALDRHFRCHTGEKPYKCEVCGKAFAQSNSCKLHVRTVHLKQPTPYVSKARQQRRRRSPALTA